MGLVFKSSFSSLMFPLHFFVHRIVMGYNHVQQCHQQSNRPTAHKSTHQTLNYSNQAYMLGQNYIAVAYGGVAAQGKIQGCFKVRHSFAQQVKTGPNHRFRKMNEQKAHHKTGKEIHARCELMPFIMASPDVFHVVGHEVVSIYAMQYDGYCG